MSEKSNSTLARIESLEINEGLVLSLDDVKISSIRSMVSVLGAQLDRIFSTRLDRKARTISVTRVA